MWDDEPDISVRYATPIRRFPITLSKEFLAKAYRKECNVYGKVLGERVFAKKTGLPVWHWRKYWPTWSAFQADVGFEPNSRKLRIPDEYLLRRLAELTLKLDKLPLKRDLAEERRRDGSIPDHQTFGRMGRHNQRLQKLEAFCQSKPEFARVVELIRLDRGQRMGLQPDPERYQGIVWLTRQGNFHHLGHERATGQRLRRLATLTSLAPGTHIIQTDDPVGVEQYWRKRFRQKHVGRKTYKLEFKDVWAFRRRTYQ